MSSEINNEFNKDLDLKELQINDKYLTTQDNPYDPRTDYAIWRQWDIDNGYHTEEYISRLANIPLDVDVDDDLTIDRLTTEAIYQILNNDVLEIYKLV